MNFVKEELLKNKDEAYKEFQAKLLPTVKKDSIIGVRTPVLREFAKQIYKNEKSKNFLKMLPHEYYEENNLHAFLIEQIIDFEECIAAVEAFLPYVDNWATCDSMRPKCFSKNTDKLLPYAEKWINSEHPYSVRYGILVFMLYYLEGAFKPVFLNNIADIDSAEYYVNMMQAWFFATALAKQYDSAIKILENNYLSTWVHNKTIQKAVESYRISAQIKIYLKSLRRK